MEMGGGVSQLKKVECTLGGRIFARQSTPRKGGGELAASFSLRHIKKGVPGVFVLLFEHGSQA